MRGVPMSHVIEELLKNNFKMNAANVEYNGGTLEEYLDSIHESQVMKASAEPETVSEIKDNQTAYSYTWSSQKISEEIAKQRRRLDTIVAVDKDTISNTEIVDIRTDIDGNHHDTAGNAVRYQFEKMRDDLNNTVSKTDLRNINRFESESIRLTNDGIIGKRYVINGNDSNIIKVPNITNYSIFTAVNDSYEDNNFFIMGVSNGKEESYIFTNRVMKQTEMLDIHVFYVKITN